MPVILPTSPEPCAPYGPPTVVSLRNDVTSLVGGNRQRSNRKGDHYRVRFNMPPLTYEEAMVWRRLMTGADTVVMTIPQPGFDTGAPGSEIAVNGGGQLGTSLIIKGVTPHYVFRAGQMVSIQSLGRWWAYGVLDEAVADEDGEATLTLEVMIRTLHADNDPIEVAEPKVEGLPDIDADAWTLDDNGFIRLNFSIEERG
jgi:hypothetical protein